MNQFKNFLLIFLLSFGCSQQHNEPTFQGNPFVLGQWETKNKDWPHWIMFDSLNNYYRWSFDEESPVTPEAKFIVEDSTITFTYPPLNIHPPMGDDSIESQLKFKLINQNSFTILPLDSGIMTTYIYERSEFEGPRYAEVYIYHLKEEEKDSLVNSGIPEAQNEWDTNMKNFEEIFYEFEFSFIRSFYKDSSYIVTRDSAFNKFMIGNYGAIYFRNDSTWIRPGIPNRTKLRSELARFFTFINQ